MGKRIRCKKLALGKPFLQSGSTRAGSSSSIGRNYSAAKPRRELSEVLEISKMRVKSTCNSLLTVDGGKAVCHLL
jgi:hypothetical protein